MENTIKVFFTGGTIGSVERDKVVSLDGSSADALLAAYREKYGDAVRLDGTSLLNLHSENLLPQDLYDMVAAVRALDAEQYRGVVITHGTDTLDFTANYLAMALSDVALPVVLVSSLYPLRDARSNGLVNFAGAVTFILQEGLPGVYVSFANPGEPVQIHLGSRLLAPDPITGCMHSLCGVSFGHVEGRFVHHKAAGNPSVAALRDRVRTACPSRLSSDVLFIPSRALLDFSCYDWKGTAAPKAVVLGLYHSGTFCTKGDRYDFSEFAARCARAGIPVILATADSTANVYQSATSIPAGCTVAYDVSQSQCLVKVMLALGNGVPIAEMLEKNIFFEKFS